MGKIEVAQDRLSISEMTLLRRACMVYEDRLKELSNQAETAGSGFLLEEEARLVGELRSKLCGFNTATLDRDWRPGEND